MTDELKEKTEVKATDDKKEDPLLEKVKEFFETQINPFLAQHGGGMSVVKIEDEKVKVTWQGACVGCGSTQQTVYGVEAHLMESFPEITGLEILQEAREDY